MGCDINAVIRDNLVAMAKAYAAGRGVTLGTTSKKFYGNVGFFAELERGTTTISIKKLEEVVDAMLEDWPPGVGRPEVRDVAFKSMFPRRGKNGGRGGP